MLQKHTTHNRPQCNRTAHGGRPGTDGLAPFLWWEDHSDDGKRHRQNRGGANTHEPTEDDELLRVGGKGTQGGGGCEK